MSGLRRIAKLYGGIVLGGKKYAWDYARDEAVPEAEMPFGSDRHRASERAKRKAAGAQTRQEPPCDS